MDCRDAEELVSLYALGTLDPRERSVVDSHVSTCQECAGRLSDGVDIVAELAYALPQLEAPPRVKQRLLSRIDDVADPKGLGPMLGRWLRSLPRAGRRLAAHSSLAVASIMVAVMVVGSLWFDNRLSEVVQENETLSAQLKAVSPREPETIEAALELQFQAVAAPVVEAVTRVNAQRIEVLSHLAGSPGASVGLLLGTEKSARAVGMVVSRQAGDSAILTALNLNPLPSHKIYKVWLIKGDRTYSAGELAVDSTGYGQAIIQLFGGPDEYDYIVITIEDPSGGAELLGESVLEGHL
jgi:anti-sigma factor RsiW